MIDVRDLPSMPTSDDFLFRVGTTIGPMATNGTTPTMTGRGHRHPRDRRASGAGPDGADRVTLIWADAASVIAGCR